MKCSNEYVEDGERIEEWFSMMMCDDQEPRYDKVKELLAKPDVSTKSLE